MARILIIEDHPENLELMRFLLDAHGHAVIVAGDGERGLALAREHIPDLILCDIHLPGKDGFQVARDIRRDPRLRTTPLLAVTALAMASDREKGMKSGYDGYIAKPIEPKHFLAEIHAVLHLDPPAPPPQPRLATIDARPAAPQEPRGTILVVDDSPTNRELITQTLTPSGYRVTAVDTVADALELMRASPPDLILSDLHMPDRDGFELVLQIKLEPRLANIPFFFLSSSVRGERDKNLALRLGVTRFLVRPVEPEQLLDEIEKYLNRPSGN